MPRIPDDIKAQILDRASLHNVLKEYHGLHKKKGASYVMDCPKCGVKDKLEYSEAKEIAKCFKCDIGVKTPANYLQKFQGLTYGQSLEELARIEGVVIPKGKLNEKRKASHQVPYIQDFLGGSGLNTGDITGPVYVDEETRKEVPSYVSGTVDTAFEIVPGDDVIIHYYDLDGRPMQYYRKDKKGNPVGKKRNFYRVRYQNPELHKDKNDNPIKYRSPFGSDTKIYINKWIREKYKKSSKIQTLYIQEGEKKADKATKHGLISVGIMGIHNIAYQKRLPVEFEAIIKRCQVENVVFVLDSDWDQLGNRIDSNHSADQRPKSFFRAVVNFRNHFYAFTNNDIYLNIYFGYVKPNPEKDKGIDDLLVNSLRNKETELKPLCEAALKEPKGDATWLQFHNITSMSEYKIMGFWHLGNVDDFTAHYRERLRTLPKFRYGSIEWRYNDKGARELAQPLMPQDTFWNEDIRKDDHGRIISKKLSFNHHRCYTFLRNRGYYRLGQPNNSFIWIKIEGNIVTRVEPYQIKDFVIDFTEQLNKEDVLNMLYRGGRMYLGPESLGNLHFTNLALHSASKNTQYIYFNKNFFKITDEGIELEEIKNLNGQVWRDNIIDFSPIKTEPLLSEVHQINENDIRANENLANFKGEYSVGFSESGNRCHFLSFLLNTSTFFGKDKSFEDATFEERFETTRHLLSKLTAFGYMLHRYRNAAVEKAVVGMDGTMSEVGKSNGRSGKSLFGLAVEQLIPTVTIPGKKRNLLEDQFLFQEVDQRTAAIFFDDVRSNFDFEFLFPYITGKFTLEKKGMGKMTLPRDFVQKFYISTNHALRGDGGSFEDRQFMLGFSNWYNARHKPIDDFKVMFFDEWDETQWNLFYNLAALCLHLYFKHGLIPAPSEKLINRKLRQEMGEQFLDWAEEYFSNPQNVQCQIYKDTMYQATRGEQDHMQHGDGFVTKYPGQRRFTPIQIFKTKVKLYCKYKGFDFNPSKNGGDIKKGGKEYLAVFIPEEDYEQIKAELPVEDELPI
ncbi:MAG: CHC2 zinc finger domain-containing protein [Flavobacteriaceae bacterium]